MSDADRFHERLRQEIHDIQRTLGINPHPTRPPSDDALLASVIRKILNNDDPLEGRVYVDVYPDGIRIDGFAPLTPDELAAIQRAQEAK